MTRTQTASSTHVLPLSLIRQSPQSLEDVVAQVHAHQEHLQVLGGLARTRARVDEQRHQMLLAGVHSARVFQLLPVLHAFQQLVFALGSRHQVRELAVEDPADLDGFLLSKPAVDRRARPDDQEALTSESTQGNAHAEVRFGTEGLEDGDLDDGDVGLGVHDHEGDEDAVIVAALGLASEGHALLLESGLDVSSEFWRAADGVGEVVGLCGEAVVVVVEGRGVVVEDRPLLLLPVRREQQDGLGLRELLLDALKLLVEKGVFFLVDERHGTAPVRDENRGHRDQLWQQQ